MNLRKYISVLFLSALPTVCLYTQQDDAILEEQGWRMLKQDREKTAEKIAEINTLLDSVGNKQKSGLYSLSLIQKKIDSRKSTLRTIDKQIGSLELQLGEKRQAVEQLQADLTSVKCTYKDLINRYYYMQMQDESWVTYIMASESLAQAYRRMRYVKEILTLLHEHAEKITVMTNRLNDEIKNISKKQLLLSSNISDKRKEMEILRLEEKQSQTVYSELKQQESDLKKQLQEREKYYNQVNVQMRELMRSELKAKRESGITDEMLNDAKDFEEMKGFLPQPAIGVVVTPFGTDKTKSVYDKVKMKPNQGVDILTAENAEVYAVFRGEVSRVFKTQGKVNVIIRHGKFYTLYASLASSPVKAGDRVTARQKVGTVKKSSDGSILHFELWKDLEVQNPEQWIIQ